MVPKIAGKLQDYVKMDHWLDIVSIKHCCNGLLLLNCRVVNPATRQWERLPPCPVLPQGTVYFGDNDAYLAFDPTMSPHYEVLLLPYLRGHDDKQREGVEWPPSPYVMCVYSSRAGRWEERPFVRKE
ncbi:hypothetical protein PR202_gb11423 [Eleusine coracana subsp. coracana]|uniref:F-box protein n=1 Tax=Eleusine coracana subsp. coracana TaxID=191504 RepID=A0AAV5ENF8_ELECO|nr:hypothetical protein PR202_gb11423 [Eleusine coracana subsp. coracana]